MTRPFVPVMLGAALVASSITIGAMYWRLSQALEDKGHAYELVRVHVQMADYWQIRSQDLIKALFDYKGEYDACKQRLTEVN